MSDFAIGFVSSLAATAFGWLVVRHLWPFFVFSAFYRGVRIDGSWEIHEVRNGESRVAGKIKLKQLGARITGESERTLTREGKPSQRRFLYNGSIHGHQVTLSFEDNKGRGFDTGTYVFIVQNDGTTMVGMATFHGKGENRIVSEPRTLKKVVE